MKMLLICLLLLVQQAAYAHKPSDSYLNLETTSEGVRGEWRIAVRDLDAAVGLDGDGDRRLTWGELRRRHRAIERYALERLRIVRGEQACVMRGGVQQVEELSDGAYTVLPLAAICAASGALAVEYDLLFDIDPTHRGLVALDAGSGAAPIVLSPERNRVRLDAGRRAAGAFASMLREGVHHIWAGYDHLLFLGALLLSAGLRRDAANPRRGALLKDVFMLVTAFTLAHSVTLTLAALRLVALPDRLIETAIGASVVVAGWRARQPQPRPALWLTFGFGLIHGFGFANVLAAMQTPRDALVSSLFAFNVGVELGQCAVVLLALPLLLWLQRAQRLHHLIAPVAAVCIVCIGLAWTVQRAIG